MLSSQIIAETGSCNVRANKQNTSAKEWMGGGGWETKAKKGWIPSCQNVGKTPLQVLMV